MAEVNNSFCCKESIRGFWQEGNLIELENHLSERDLPFLKEEKQKLPLFGFARKIGAKENTIQYPTNFVILELDTPKHIKSKIEQGDDKLNQEYIMKFKAWFNEFKGSDSIDYHTLYLTPSMRGLRFILEVREAVNNEREYKQIVKGFLENLKAWGIGESFYDILINQAWYFPTFKKFFHKKNKFYIPTGNVEKRKSTKKKKSKKSTENNKICVKTVEKDFKTEEKVFLKIFSFLQKTKKSITKNYGNWVKVGFALINTFPENLARDFFIKISELDSSFDKHKCIEKFESLKNGIPPERPVTFGSIMYLAKKQGFKNSARYIKEVEEKYAHIKFWNYSSGNKQNPIEIHQYKLCKFLSQNGFYILQQKKGYLFVRLNKNILNEVTLVEIKDFIKNYFEQMGGALPDGLEPIELLNKLMKGNNSYFGKGLLEFLDKVNLKENRDSKEVGYFCFQNGVVKVTKEGLSLISYSELKGYVWRSQTINRKIIIRDELNPDFNFSIFLQLISGNEKSNFKRLCTIIGYLLHQYKDETNAKAVVFSDKMISKKSNGGTGKTLTANAIGKLCLMHPEDGKNFKVKSQFKFQQVNHDTQVILFDDVNSEFDFSKLYSVITGNLTIERKNKDAYNIDFESSPKILITSNHHVFVDDGESDLRRKITFEFSSEFDRKNTPQQKFGKRFFSEWDGEEWNEFYLFMLNCVSMYLKEGIPHHEVLTSSESLIEKRTNSGFADFTEDYLKEVLKDDNFSKKQDKKSLYSIYTEHYASSTDIVSQSKFTSFLRIFCKIEGITAIERKSNGKNLIEFKPEK